MTIGRHYYNTIIMLSLIIQTWLLGRQVNDITISVGNLIKVIALQVVFTPKFSK